MTKQDMFTALRFHPKAPEAIFWWCFSWYSGAHDDLYKIMCDDSLGYVPDPKRTAAAFITDPQGNIQSADPEVGKLLSVLDETFKPLVGAPYQRVKLTDVQEGHILVTEGDTDECLRPKTPYKVYRHNGALGVACTGSKIRHIKLTNKSENYFHRITEDAQGYVVGFRR